MFVIHHGPNGLRLMRDGVIVPVSESYLNVLCREAGIALQPGEVAAVSTAIGRTAIEESLGRISQEIASAGQLRRSLLRHLLARSGPASQSA